MSKSKISDKIMTVFNRCFFAVFFLLYILIASVGLLCICIGGELNKNIFPFYHVIGCYLLIILNFVLITFLLVLYYRFISSSKLKKFDSKKFNNTIIFGSVAVILLVQLFYAYCLKMNPVTDVNHIEQFAIKSIKEDSFDCVTSGFNEYYIVKYQNNLAYFFIMRFLYKLTYTLTGTFSHEIIIIINTLALNITVLLTVLTARRIFGNRKALITLLLCAMFSPYYTYTAYFYTDSFSIPFVIGAVYCFIAALQSQKRNKKAVFLILTGALCFIAFKIKGSAIILIAAILIYTLLKFGIKRFIKISVPVLLSFGVLFASYSYVLNKSNIIPPEVSNRYQYPATHWIMMGLKDQGAYNIEDSMFTTSQPSKGEKTAANLRVIKERLEEKGVFGTIYHVFYKAVWSWMDGTYYIANYLRNYCNKTPLHSFVLYSGEYRFIYYSYCTGYQMFLILMMIFSALQAIRKRKTDITTLFRITVFGVLIFFMIWETNSRYPFNFTPLYILLATQGLGEFSSRLKLRKIKRNRKIE